VTDASRLERAPSLTSLGFQGNPATNVAGLRAKLTGPSVLTEGDVCAATRERLPLAGWITQAERDLYTKRDFSPVFANRSSAISPISS